VVERALERELTGFFYGQREPRSGVTPEAPESGENPEILALRTA